MNQKSEFITRFEQLGVDQVRRKWGGSAPLGSQAGSMLVYEWAHEWLAQFDLEDRLLAEANRTAAERTARSAKNAAWAAAIAATAAAIAAIISAVIAFRALLP